MSLFRRALCRLLGVDTDPRIHTALTAIADIRQYRLTETEEYLLDDLEAILKGHKA